MQMPDATPRVLWCTVSIGLLCVLDSYPGRNFPHRLLSNIPKPSDTLWRQIHLRTSAGCAPFHTLIIPITGHNAKIRQRKPQVPRCLFIPRPVPSPKSSLPDCPPNGLDQGVPLHAQACVIVSVKSGNRPIPAPAVSPTRSPLSSPGETPHRPKPIWQGRT